MLRQQLTWELELDWSEGVTKIKDPEKSLRVELSALNHFAHNKNLYGVKKLLEILENNDWVFTEKSAEHVVAIDFESVKDIRCCWEEARESCNHKYADYYDVNEFNIVCRLREKAGRKYNGCNFNKERECKNFKPELRTRSFNEIVEEVNKP